MQHLWKKAAAVGFLALCALGLVGTIHAFTLPYPQLLRSSLPMSLPILERNLPTANNLRQVGLGEMPLPLLLEQGNVERIRVYERSGQLALATDAFDDDEALIRSAVTVHQALVLNEKSSGMVRERRLVLELGIHPGQFDALMNQLRGIGHLESVSVQQRDRTGEFQRLHAQRQSLQKRHAAILKLRETKNLSIDDTLRLEQRLQDIDKELETVGVQLGDLLSKESLYHVYVALAEYYPGSRLDPAYIWPQLRYGLIWGLGRWSALALGIGGVFGIWFSFRTLWPAKTTAPHVT
ncbi:MAG TPA: DUF4349 domain-containing protein [Pirellulales bacterium]|nr:DUF4349 domain-containing protein [Pirellulales bacterium]